MKFQQLDLNAPLAVTEQPFYTHLDVPPVAPLDTAPTALQDYVVIVNQGLSIADLERDLERDTTLDNSVDSSIIPDRIVDVANRRPASDTQTHYWLTAEEAEKLRNHPAVFDVELNPTINPEIRIIPTAIQQSDFTKQEIFGTALGNTANWGLIRCSANTNIYGTGTTTAYTYDYIADGTGVDVVIMDSGIDVDHPEFQDANGNSRVQQINWYTAANIGGTMPANFYTDTEGHGTAVASVVAGKTFGWAKNANIYAMNILGGAGTTIDTATAFDLITAFHNNKGIDPTLGTKRPTIVNGSWGVTSYVMSSPAPFSPYSHSVYVGYQIWSGNYRGSSWSGYDVRPEYGLTGTAAGTYPNGSSSVSTLYQINGYSSTYDSALASMLASGVHYVKASGNDHCKQDISTGADYNNYVNIITGISGGQPVLTSRYYNRPASPWAEGCINVGATDTDSYSSTLDQRAGFSGYGTAIDTWAPGVGIVCAYISGDTYAGNVSYFQKNEVGTSFASPQVAGVLSLFAQQNPGVSPANAKKWVTSNNQGCVSSVIWDDGSTTDYSYGRSLSGGDNKFLYNPFKASNITLGTNGLRMINGTITFRT